MELLVTTRRSIVKHGPVLLACVPLLFLMGPAFYYSMDTPIGLFERSAGYHWIYHSIGDFISSLKRTITETSPRFRPFLSFWIGLHWKLFGEVAWPFQLSRWLIQFSALALFIAAFTRIATAAGPTGARSQQSAGLLLIIPVALLAYLWLTYPNVCLVRIECVETFTVFFLGLCNWAAALMLTAPKGQPRTGHHVLFFVGFVGLVSSKEPNVAPALWLLVCYWAWVIAGQVRKGGYLIVAALMALTLGFTIYKVNRSLLSAAELGAYFTESDQSTSARFTENAMDILQGLFQWETSKAITAAFVFLLLTLIVLLAVKLKRQRLDGEFMFLVLLLGEFMAMFLVLSYQGFMTLRYWSILVPCLAMLSAFAAKFLLEATKRRRLPANGVAVVLAAFIVLFVSTNYYNFLYQIIGHHSARNLDELVIREVARLLNAEQYIMVREVHEQSLVLNSYWNWQRHWPQSPWGEHSVHGLPPEDAEMPYYVLDIYSDAQPSALETLSAWHGRSAYDVLDFPREVSAFVQGREVPHIGIDAGMSKLGDYRMAMYRSPSAVAP